MAIAGSAKPSIVMRMVNGTLETGTIALRQNVVSDAAVAVRLLMAGETVFVSVYGDLTERVCEGVAAAMLRETGD